MLNHYLSEMSDAILDNGGTLVAYMGDGIFAVCGAPLEQPDHADRALRAAREMLEVRLPRFNEWIRSQGLGDGFRMGIGRLREAAGEFADRGARCADDDDLFHCNLLVDAVLHVAAGSRFDGSVLDISGR